jgi:5-methylcytosine-specific restriction endonuclease McrA
MWKPTKNPKIEEMTKSFKDRALQLSRYPVKPDANDKRMCLWCGEVELIGSKLKKYCSPECSEAIFTWAQPQKENGLHALMVRQDWQCNVCHFDYKPTRDKVLDYFHRKNWFVPNFGRHDSRRYMKVFKNNCPTDRKPEVDHIIPIYKGGQSLGLANHQAICYSCHKAKTKVDLSGKRKKT